MEQIFQGITQTSSKDHQRDTRHMYYDLVKYETPFVELDRKIRWLQERWGLIRGRLDRHGHGRPDCQA
jgi:hypothetical protein